MDYFWRQNKAFVITVGAGVVAALLWHGCIISPIRRSADAIRQERETADLALVAAMASGQVGEDMIARAEKDLQRTDELVEALIPDVGAPEKPPFRAPEGKPAADYFGNLHLDVWRKLQESAEQARVGLAQRESPFGRVSSASPEAARELLIRLALVERICRAAVDAAVDRVDSVTPAPGIADLGEASADPSFFLNLLRVQVKMRGSSESIFKVVHALQKKGSFYAVTSFRAVKEEEHADMFVCELEAAALLVNPKGAVASPEKGKP
jgi:hypothetical protein